MSEANRNAHAGSTFCRIAEALSTGIWDDAAFANYVAIVEHGSSKMVGILEGLYGTTTLLVALPFGTLADRWRRDRVLRICGVLELGVPSSRQLIDRLLWCVGRPPHPWVSFQGKSMTQHGVWQD
jgi:MFS family permease